MLLPIRIPGNKSGESWHQMKKILGQQFVPGYQAQHGIISRANKVTTEQKRVLDALQTKSPKRYLAGPTPNRRKNA